MLFSSLAFNSKVYYALIPIFTVLLQYSITTAKNQAYNHVNYIDCHACVQSKLLPGMN
jgi:hypothetical protein